MVGIATNPRGDAKSLSSRVKFKSKIAQWRTPTCIDVNLFDAIVARSRGVTLEHAHRAIEEPRRSGA